MQPVNGFAFEEDDLARSKLDPAGMTGKRPDVVPGERSEDRYLPQLTREIDGRHGPSVPQAVLRAVILGLLEGLVDVPFDDFFFR